MVLSWHCWRCSPGAGNHSIIPSCSPLQTRHRLEAYATLHRRVVKVGARNSRQEAFRKIARHSGEHCSIGFQPVSGFGSETGRNPNGPFRARTILNRPYLRAIQPWARLFWPLRATDWPYGANHIQTPLSWLRSEGTRLDGGHGSEHSLDFRSAISIDCLIVTFH